MPARTINFIVDAPTVRRHIEKRVQSQVEVAGPISAIEAGFKLCQDGRFILNFDLREWHERDGEWTLALDGPALVLPHWRAAYGAAANYGIGFILLAGQVKHVKPGEGDTAVASEFGKALLWILLDAKARGSFDPLPLRSDCQLEVLGFDGMWERPKAETSLGKSNLFRKLKADRLPD